MHLGGIIASSLSAKKIHDIAFTTTSSLQVLFMQRNGLEADIICHGTQAY